MTVRRVSAKHQYVGLAADTKPTTGIPFGSTFLVLDEGVEYVYDGAAWRAQPDASGWRRASKSHNLTGDNADLFTVTGKVAIWLLTGEVTTIVATTTTYAMRVKTSGEAIFPATTITTDAVGTMYLFGGDNTVVLNNAGTPITRVGFLDSAGPVSPIIVGLAAGSCIIESDLDAAGTGVILWTLLWMPLSAGASLVAA